jgi:hypothetical protein
VRQPQQEKGKVEAKDKEGWEATDEVGEEVAAAEQVAGILEEDVASIKGV